uniref:Oxysterol-binding protein n=1 Tax=Phallusia mammillata TaxID=59560 RepID=A0A6F9DNV8_9ASCI|nr:oxysterol-binding protein-related protein 9 [Phallusia mammillata]
MAAYMEGPLSKWTNVMKGWQYRWFVLDDNTGLLSYYTSKDKMKRGSRRGCVRLRDAIIGIDDEDDSTFTITVDQKVFHFQARDAEERKQWAGALEDTILRHSHRQVETMSNTALDEFDRRLAEADAYLQLLLENIKGVENKIDALESSTEKQNMEGILMTAQEMVEAVKKSIVLLQIAKTAVTVNVSSNAPLHLKPSDSLITGANVEPLPSSELPKGATSFNHNEEPQPEQGNGDVQACAVTDVSLTNGEDVIPDSEELSEVHSKIIEAQHVKSNDVGEVDSHLTPPPSTIQTMNEVPARSYSSSEDEGEFYDAEDLRSIKSNRSKSSADEQQHSTRPAGQSTSAQIPIVSENVDIANISVSATNGNTENEHSSSGEQNLYMFEEDANANKEGESVEEHKSVIMHLLSQVKLGMDLTKVVLPTFILERRSLLEMYADFLAHPDLFLQVADEATPETRMMAFLRFYLSTFSAGRDSSVAKKPYNPILGETFQCFYDLSSDPNQSSDSQPVEQGPVPWASSDQVAFVAEQVSHHPPISAFYAEHKDKKVQFNGHIWTKSKFLGLSIGVHNIGQGCLRLLEHDEEYIVNFPNGYGRSILTIPWVELGGDCTVTCEKTGYNAFVKFHTKPFYGGKVHRVTSEVFAPNAKKPFCTIDGEWNGQMWANYSTGRSECFFDAKKKMKSRKYVRSLERQEPTESRRLWRKVTVSLETNNIDEATDAKRFLEDRQRQDAKNRLETGTVYKPKLFHEDDCQNWIYNTSLTDRNA